MPGGQAALHLADDVHHVGVTLNHHQVLDLDGAWLADAAKVIAAQIHQHHVLRPFLGIGQQIGLEVAILQFGMASGTGAGDRAQACLDPSRDWVCLDHHLGAGADQLPVAEVEEGHIRRWIHHPQAAVKLQGLLGHAGLEALAEHQLEHITSCDVVASPLHGGFKIFAAAVAGGLRRALPCGLPAQRADRRQWCRHALFQTPNTGHGVIPSGFRARRIAATEVAVGHSCDQPFHLIENQDAVHQHPDPIGRGPFRQGMRGNGGLDPADQFVTPDAEQLADRRQPREGTRLVRSECFSQHVEWIAAELIATAIAPLPLDLVIADREGPKRIAGHHAVATEGFSSLNRFQQNARRTSLSHFEPCGEGSLQVCRPAACHGDERGTSGSGLKERGAVGAEH